MSRKRRLVMEWGVHSPMGKLFLHEYGCGCSTRFGRPVLYCSGSLADTLLIRDNPDMEMVERWRAKPDYKEHVAAGSPTPRRKRKRIEKHRKQSLDKQAST